jgi:hypothetical protein
MAWRKASTKLPKLASKMAAGRDGIKDGTNDGSLAAEVELVGSEDG